MTQITPKQASEYFTYLTTIEKAMMDKKAVARARYTARKHGYSALKSRTRRSMDNYGGFALIEDGNLVAGSRYDMTPADVINFCQGAQ